MIDSETDQEIEEINNNINNLEIENSPIPKKKRFTLKCKRKSKKSRKKTKNYKKRERPATPHSY